MLRITDAVGVRVCWCCYCWHREWCGAFSYPGTTFWNKGKEQGGAAIIQIGLWHPLWEVSEASCSFSGIRGEYTRAINLTGHWVWPRSTLEEAEAVLRGFALAEFRQTRAGTHTCEYTHHASSLSEGKV